MMTTLIERLEAAEAGSRELDAEIAVATGIIGQDNLGRWCCSKRNGQWEYTGGFSQNAVTPAYTTCFDAAITLVPEGWKLYSIMYLHDRWLATLVKKDGSRSGLAVDGAFPALALTAAALRAKEIEE